MTVYLVTNDLIRAGKNYDKIQAFKTKYDHRRLSESSYLIKSDKKPVVLFGEIQLSLREDDTLYIFSINKPYAGKGEPETTTWIYKYL